MKRLFVSSGTVGDVLLTVALVAVVSLARILLAPVLYDRSAFMLFTLAVLLSASKGGWRMGVLATVLAGTAGVWLFVRPFYEASVHDIQDGVQTLLFAMTGLGISFLAEQLRRARLDAEQESHRRQLLITELRESMENVRALHGLLPICASCKKIRDDRGYWQQLEVYIRDHSEADFSHGLCPDCAKAYWNS